MDTVAVHHYDDVYIRVRAEPGLMMELADFFTFQVPNFKFHPLVKNRMWDGKIRLFNSFTGLIYAGLRARIRDFCEARGYDYLEEDDFASESFSVAEAKQFIAGLDLKIEPRDYQVQTFIQMVRDGRSLLLSPTNSGKSLIIYLLARYYHDLYQSRVLVVVPRTSLVSQLAGDFHSYSPNAALSVHQLFAGQDKTKSAPITVATWQSIYKLGQEFFERFQVVIGDEAHEFKAKSLIGIMSKLKNCPIKFGTTGTLDGALTNQMVLEGLFGPVRSFITAAELIEKKYSAEFKIKAILLKHDKPPDLNYQDEIEFLCASEARNRFIKNLALSLEGNTLLLFTRIEKHGVILHQMITEAAPDRHVYFIHGGVDVEERERIRQLLDEEDNAILLASFGTFSEGVNAPKLHNTIFASPYKSRIRNLQSIGRGLRRTATKTTSTLYDIADDLSGKRKKKNATFLHFIERIRLYSTERFPYRIYNVALEPSNKYGKESLRQQQ